MTPGADGPKEVRPVAARPFSEGLDAAKRILRTLLRESPALAAVWVVPVALGMTPLGRQAFLVFNPSPSLWRDGTGVLGVTLLTLIVGSVAGAAGVSVIDRRRSPSAAHRDGLEPWHLGVLTAVAGVAFGAALAAAAFGLVLGVLALVVTALVELFLVLVGGLFIALIALGILSLFAPGLAAFLLRVLGGLVAIPVFILGMLRGWRLGELFGFGTPTIRRGAASHLNADGRPKVSYPTERAAWDEAVLFARDRGQLMNAYECEQGGHWHIGHTR
jgi:hypothetical protein